MPATTVLEMAGRFLAGASFTRPVGGVGGPLLVLRMGPVPRRIMEPLLLLLLLSAAGVSTEKVESLRTYAGVSASSNSDGRLSDMSSSSKMDVGSEHDVLEGCAFFASTDPSSFSTGSPFMNCVVYSDARKSCSTSAMGSSTMRMLRSNTSALHCPRESASSRMRHVSSEMVTLWSLPFARWVLKMRRAYLRHRSSVPYISTTLNLSISSQQMTFSSIRLSRQYW
mmetsp:Transcript_34962/g.87989  ORF Transcript_34962/g.87989 Transcript_34962/m.87989 type:complete len:225 (+) Transcript_34962:1332-2006(+)